MCNFCTDCIHWEQVAKLAGDSFGICDSSAVAMNVALDGKTHLGEGGTLWTQALFGCIYWRDRGNSMVDFDDIINSDTGEII